MSRFQFVADNSATSRPGWTVKRLCELVEEKGEEYYRTNMRFALPEYWSMRTGDDHVLERESYWREVLHARSLGQGA